MQLRINRYKRENDKQKYLLIIMIFFYFCSWKCVLHLLLYITNTVISLVAHKLHQIHMNNQENFTTRSSKLKVHRANSQTISSYPVKFSTYSLFFSLSCLFFFFFCFFFFFFFFFFFSLFCFFFFFFVFLFFCFFFYFLKLKV